MNPMEAKFNIWFEVDDEVATSLWRVELLEAIDKHGSITGGAKAMGVPYRVAWQKVHDMEERLGIQLLETQTGGSEGGGAALTGAGRAHVREMRHFANRAERAIGEIRHEVFGPKSG